jgi:hypothetical protein
VVPTKKPEVWKQSGKDILVSQHHLAKIIYPGNCSEYQPLISLTSKLKWVMQVRLIYFKELRH